MEGPCGIHCTGPYPASGADQAGGLTEFLFALGGGGDPMSPQLATAGQVDPDRASVTMTLRQGVAWHSLRGFEDIDFGEMTSRVITDVDFKRVPGRVEDGFRFLATQPGQPGRPVCAVPGQPPRGGARRHRHRP